MYHHKRLKDLTLMYGEAFGNGVVVDTQRKGNSGLPRNISDELVQEVGLFVPQHKTVLH